MEDVVFPKREWISAQDSYATQSVELVAMVDRLHRQILDAAPPKPRRVAFIGIGASHAAAASPVFEMRRDNLDALRFLPSELPGGLSGFEGLAVLISQSGRSAEVVALADRQARGERFAVTNYDPSPLGMLCGRGLNLGNLSDSSVSFVSFTGTMLALAMLNDHWNGRNRADAWKRSIAESAEAVERRDADLLAIAQMLNQATSIDVVAPAPVMSTAEEASLMFREGPRLFATAMETRQYLHGPMDAAGSGAHLVFGGEREALLVKQLAERTENLVYVSDETGIDADIPAAVRRIVLPARLDDPVGFAIASTFVAQKLTLHTARLRDIDINAAAFKRLDTKTDRVAKN